MLTNHCYFIEFLSGNVLNWQSSEWTMNGGVENETVTHDQFCEKDPHRRYVMFAQKRSLPSAYQLCRRMGNDQNNAPMVIKNEQKNWFEKIIQKYSLFVFLCKQILL
jgi:hypothetical protein